MDLPHPRILFSTLLLTLLGTTGCTTLANRRDLYFPGTVNGPYTRMKAHGIPRPAAVQGALPSGAAFDGDGKTVAKQAH
jgi:hypothetical protein